ncbi:MAG: HalD/BesD family halogenase [Hyphomicrobiaceae bacterium]
MEHILDLDRFPLHDLDSERGRALVARCRGDMERHGFFNLDGLFRPEALAACVSEVKSVLATDAYEHRQSHNIYFKSHVDGLAPDHPALRTVETVNRKICADQIPENVLVQIYEWSPLAEFLASVMGKEKLHVMDDQIACLNVMMYREGEALNWHFDRSEFTVTLLLQAPDEGGEFQYRIGLRTDDDPNYEGVGRFVSGEDATHETVRLSPGTLNVFRGKNTAHRVSPVIGPNERIIVVLCYYENPGVRFSDEDRIRFYGRAA